MQDGTAAMPQMSLEYRVAIASSMSTVSKMLMSLCFTLFYRSLWLDPSVQVVDTLCSLTKFCLVKFKYMEGAIGQQCCCYVSVVIQKLQAKYLAIQKTCFEE